MHLRASPMLVAALAVLAGCHAKAGWTTSDGAKGAPADGVHIAMAKSADGGGDRLSVNIPGFDGKLSLPAMNLGRHMDLDGIKLADDTEVRSVDVRGDDEDKGRGGVHIAFADPQPPAALLDYYRRAASDAGYTIGARADGALAATKHDKAFALAVAAEGGGSRGTIDLSGD